MEALGRGGDPGGVEDFEVNSLVLNEEQCSRIAKAYEQDQHTVQGVRVSDIYKTVVKEGEGVEAIARMRIEPWKNRRYFAVAPNEGGQKLLYTPRSYLRQHWAEQDNSRVLVLFVPAGVRVRITTPEAVVDEQQEEEWERLDLRRDLIIMCHGLQNHASMELTSQALKAMVYWPGLIDGPEGVRRHIEGCGCADEAGGVRNIGVGIDTTQRMAVLQVDHIVLSDERARLAGVKQILVIVDLATRFTMYVDAEDQSAVETGRLLVTRQCHK